MKRCRKCGEPKWGNKFPETDSICLCDEEEIKIKLLRWECSSCGFEHNHSKRPTKCSCRSGYVKHIKLKTPPKEVQKR